MSINAAISGVMKNQHTFQFSKQKKNTDFTPWTGTHKILVDDCKLYGEGGECMARLVDSELLDTLAGTNEWVEAGQLAEMFRVTPRTIYNHIRRINSTHDGTVIESSRQGYRLITKELADKATTNNNEGNRGDAILGHLLGPSAPINMYDLADELHMADSTLQVELHRVRAKVSKFGIEIEQHRNMLSLKGSEHSKRRLINHLITSQGSKGFSVFASSQLLNSTYKSIDLIELVSKTLRDKGLSCNDYGLNNIVLHLTVMIDRLRQGQTVDSSTLASNADGEVAWTASKEICAAISDVYRIRASESEVYYLALTITLNTQEMQEANSMRDSLLSYLSPEEIEQTRSIVSTLEQTYCLDPFDDTFETRLALHFHDLKKRAASGTYIRNPLATRTKMAYPLVYDMAVFVANEFGKCNGITINEDEIAFLAFHIGGYFENNLLDTSRITCTLLYIGYHEMHLSALDRINKVFDGKIAITNISSVSGCNLSEIASDLVLSPVPVQTPNARAVLIVNPILTDEDLDNIREALDAILSAKRAARMEDAIRQYLRPELFRKNHYVASRNEMIHDLTDVCVSKGLCNESFYEDVLRREGMSSTAIGNQVAIPHSLTALTREPFFSVVVNDRPMKWGEQRVSMVILIGISTNSRSSFRVLFDDMLAILGKPSNVAVLLGSGSYDDFVSRLEGLLTKQHENI